MMEKKSIAVLRDLIFAGKLTEEETAALKGDSRKGVQKLLRRHGQIREHQEQLEKKYIEMQCFERELYQSGCDHIAGIDEAGRGPLAGPVVAAAVILPKDIQIIGLNDSKLLNEEKRNMFYDKIKKEAISYGISIVGNEVIDDINIYEATKTAMHHAIGKLSPVPDHVLIDAVELSGLPCPANAIIKGDGRSISIAAASILAKVTRDRVMAELHEASPEYDFLTNKGYGTKHHLEMLKTRGATIHHRRSFSPVRDSLSPIKGDVDWNYIK